MYASYWSKLRQNCYSKCAPLMFSFLKQPIFFFCNPQFTFRAVVTRLGLHRDVDSSMSSCIRVIKLFFFWNLHNSFRVQCGWETLVDTRKHFMTSQIESQSHMTCVKLYAGKVVAILNHVIMRSHWKSLLAMRPCRPSLSIIGYRDIIKHYSTSL